MPDIVIFLIKANIALVLFYLGYRLLLRRLTFYNLNRFYLLFGILFSACYPLINIIDWATKQEGISAEVMDILPMWEPVRAQAFNVWPYLVIIFWLVAIFFATRMVARLFSLWVVHRGSVAARWQMFYYRQVFQPVNPFSFWRNIYLNVHQHEESALSEIFHHEHVHVEEYHTVDILVAELCSVLCWFNPGAWLYRHAIRENLEFVTDRRVLQRGADRKAYQYSLLRTGTFSGQPTLVTNFNLRSIKRRIMMMNKKKSSKLQISKYVLVMPAIAVSVLIFTITNAYQDEQVAEVDAFAKEPITDQRSVIEDTAGASTQAAAVLRVEKMNPGDTTKRKNVIAFRGLDSAGKEPLYILDGVRMDKDNGVKGFSLDQLDPARIESISVLKDGSAEAIYGESGKNGVVLITTKNGADSVTQKKPKGRVAGLSFGADSTLSKLMDEVVVVGYGPVNPADSAKAGRVAIRGAGGDKFRGALIIVDGEEIPEKELGSLNPDDIDSISVWKDSSATEKYGKKGEKGVIEIITKSKK